MPAPMVETAGQMHAASLSGRFASRSGSLPRPSGSTLPRTKKRERRTMRCGERSTRHDAWQRASPLDAIHMRRSCDRLCPDRRSLDVALRPPSRRSGGLIGTHRRFAADFVHPIRSDWACLWQIPICHVFMPLAASPRDRYSALRNLTSQAMPSRRSRDPMHAFD